MLYMQQICFVYYSIFTVKRQEHRRYKMAKKLISINEEKCTGCGLCVTACHEGAIRLVGGKAKLTHGELCDGIGDCLPACPTGAIAFEESSSSPWPVQIKLVSPAASFFCNADLLVAADCTAYAYASFHKEFMKGRVVLIGCPKLDSTDYAEKLTEILRNNEIKSLTITRMEVPCCRGMQRAAETALENSGKDIPCQTVTISTDGRCLSSDKKGC